VDDRQLLELAMQSLAGGRSAPIRVELDPFYRYPQHRRPDPQRPVMSDNDGRPTDPVVLAEIERLVGAFATRYRAERGEAPRWEAGYGEADIAAAEAQLGRVRRMSGNDRWVPFATDSAMNFGVVDLGPAPGGRYGQIYARP
jgi:hypothetical protein